MKRTIAIIFICFFLSSPLIGISKSIDESNQEITANDNGPMDSAWPTYGQNNQHTGQSPYNTLDNPMDIKWRFTTSFIGFESSPVIDKNGVLYLSCKDGFLYAINPDGSEKWRFNINHWGSHSAALADDGTIYIGSLDDHLYAINPDGSLKWRFQAAKSIWGSPVLSEEGIIYFGITGPDIGSDRFGRFYALYPDGTEKWHIDTNDYIYSTPAISDNGTVYITSNDRFLYALNPDNGSIYWKYRTGDGLGSPSIGDDGTIYIASHDHFLHAIIPDGTLKWKTEINTGSSDTPAIGNDGTIYIGEFYFYAINPDGNIKWTYKGWDPYAFEVTSYSYAISNDNFIYFVATDKINSGGDLFVLNSDGSLKFKKTIAPNDPQFGSPVIGNDGTVYITSKFVGTDSGYLYAFGEVENNQPPNKPEINGPNSGTPRNEYTFTIIGSDPDKDNISFFVDWGDDSNTGWYGIYPSGYEKSFNYEWKTRGTYQIKAKIRDEHGLESDWATFEVTMPKTKWIDLFDLIRLKFPIFESLFGGKMI